MKVEGAYAKGSDRWFFRNTYGPLIGIGDRIQGLQLNDVNGASMSVHKVGPGEFTGDRSATGFNYEVNLAPPLNVADAAHISSLDNQRGYLMLADLLPDFPVSAMRVEFVLPQSWRIVSSAVRSSQGWYDLRDKANAVFFVGPDLKLKHKKIGGADLTFVAAGEWIFSADAVIKNAARIFDDYERHTGFKPKKPVTLMLAPFSASGAKSWSAETRGSNLVLLANNSPSAKFSLGQLSVVLCHELFHAWVPNALSLDGNYDWFFEGFTLYQALCAAVRLGLIDFQEYLDTLGRVYDSYLLARESGDLSLLEASRRRWTSGSSLVYDQGMLVGFLYDLKLRKAGRNSHGLDVVYQELFRRFPAGGKLIDGNEALIPILIEQDGDEQFVRRYIQTPGAIDLEITLRDYGIRVINSGNKKRLQIADPLNSGQQEVLKGLGYRKRKQ